ncbi:hypothetical protein ABZ342_31560 [Amycolatopsis sp. NPDC005961]|uniref:hypothetical protein n=1 Tax=Amycolatopsis sp. NPDC005961 TaxID=3156720 RepID=UPI0033E97745
MGSVYDPEGDWSLPGPNGVPVAGSYGASGDPGAGFAYDEATLRELAKDWDDMADEFREDRQKANYIASAQGPGLEYASQGNADLIRTSGKALLDTLAAREEYCRAMAARFRAASGQYAATEDAGRTEIDQAGGSL